MFNGCSLISIQRCGDNLGRVRLGYSGIRISSGGVTKTQTPKTLTSDLRPQTSDLRPQTTKTQTPRIYLKRIYIVNSSQFLSRNV